MMRPLLTDPTIEPTPSDIAWTRDAFRDLLRLRAVDGRDYPGATFASLAYFVNVDKAAHQLEVAEAVGLAYRLHPLHRTETAADRRPLDKARFDRERGRFTIPARTAVVFVVE